MQSLVRPQLPAKAISRRAAAVRVYATAAPVQAPAAKMAALSTKDRAKAAVLGALVADAASMPLHWIYDVPKIHELLSAKGLEATPEFFPEPSCPFYKAAWGAQSPYGEELVPLLRSMADNSGAFDADKYAEALHAHFTGGEAYRNASVRNFLTNWEAGKRGAAAGCEKDFQANCFARAAIVVARYAGHPDLRAKVEAAIRVQQNNDDAVKYGMAGAMLLEKVLLGHSLDDALAWAMEQGSMPTELQQLVQRALDTRKAPLKELTYEPVPFMAEMVGKHMAVKDSLHPFTWAVWCNGPACTNPAAFANVAMTVAQFGGSGYVEAVRRNMLAGGDNCSRSCLIGALFAAQDGLSAVPTEWRSKTSRYAECEALVDKMLAAV